MNEMRLREPGNATQGDAQLVVLSYDMPEEVQWSKEMYDFLKRPWDEWTEEEKRQSLQLEEDDRDDV